MPESKDALLDKLYDSVTKMEPDLVEEVANQYKEAGYDPLEGIEKSLVAGLREIGEKFDSGEYFLPELILGAESAKTGIDILEPLLKEGEQKRDSKGTILFGTVEGDLHDIGKDIVIAILTAHGFEVKDLGAEVPTQTFVEKTREFQPNIVALSALMTSTMVSQRDVIEALKESGLRDDVKVMIGGAPISEEWRNEIEADAYGKDATDAVNQAEKLVSSN